MKALPREILSDIEHNDDFVVVRKWDGFSEELVIENGVVRLFNKSGAEHSDNVPSLTRRRLDVPNMRLQAEGVGPGGNINSTKSILGSKPLRAIAYQKEHGNLQLVAHNILEYRGESLAHIPFGERLGTLKKAACALRNEDLSNVHLESLRSWAKLGCFENIVALGGEGVVVKKLSGFERDMFKIKRIKSWDVIIIGFTEANPGKFGGLIGAIRYGAFDIDGNLKEIGRCSGMVDVQRVTFSVARESFVGRVIEVRGQEIGSNGGIRFPRFIRLRDDKPPTDCLLHEIKEETK